RPVEVGGEVLVAEAEPGGAAVALEALHRAPGLVAQAPAPLGVDGVGQRVDDRVEVGADVQPVEVDVVADVDDGGDQLGRHHLHDAGQEPGGAPPAGQHRHVGLPGGVHAMPWSFPSRRATSASTISCTSPSKVVFGFQPSTSLAFEASPTSRSTSAGRKNFSSMTTCFSQSRPTWSKASSQNSRTEWVSPVAIT